MSISQKLKILYNKSSKHSHYQTLASPVREIIGDDYICASSRYEQQRLNYIVSILDPKDKKILDIGGNTGFFSFEMLMLGAESVVYYEGNKEHSEFVRYASDCLQLSHKISINNQYFDFDHNLPCLPKEYDITLVLNVLHHIGDDYGEKELSMQNAKQAIIRSLNNLCNISKYLVLQLGFCWKGNRKNMLFEHGTKQEMLEFLYQGISVFWEIIDVGIAERNNNQVKYVKQSSENMKRNDDLGEFLNRPILVLQSRHLI